MNKRQVSAIMKSEAQAYMEIPQIRIQRGLKKAIQEAKEKRKKAVKALEEKKKE